jgi:predicted nucleic acid-binding protein
MIWVIDASVALRWLLKEEEHQHADAILRSVIDYPGSFSVPELFCFEVLSVLCRLHPSPIEAYLEGILPIIQSEILRQPMSESLVSNAGFFTKKGLSGYDATYAALAAEPQKGRRSAPLHPPPKSTFYIPPPA